MITIYYSILTEAWLHFSWFIWHIYCCVIPLLYIISEGTAHNLYIPYFRSALMLPVGRGESLHKYLNIFMLWNFYHKTNLSLKRLSAINVTQLWHTSFLNMTYSFTRCPHKNVFFFSFFVHTNIHYSHLATSSPCLDTVDSRVVERIVPSLQPFSMKKCYNDLVHLGGTRQRDFHERIFHEKIQTLS